MTAPATPLFAAPLPQNLINPHASTTVELQAPTPTNPSTVPSNITSTSRTADEQEQQEDVHNNDNDAVLDDNLFSICLAHRQWNRLYPLLVHSILLRCTHIIKGCLDTRKSTSSGT
ncbi:hypothetical protein Tco_1270802 [Tanacetum coccineum]